MVPGLTEVQHCPSVMQRRPGLSHVTLHVKTDANLIMTGELHYRYTLIINYNLHRCI